MNDGRISVRYARALLLWVNRQDKAYDTFVSARDLVSVLQPREFEIAQRLGDGVVSEARKLGFVDELLGGYNAELQELGRLMVKRGRGAYLVRALRVFVRLYERQEYIQSVEVRSAQAISEAHRARLEGYLQQEFGARIETYYVLDSDLIGGFQLLVDGRRYDRSVRGELRRLALQLRG